MDVMYQSEAQKTEKKLKEAINEIKNVLHGDGIRQAELAKKANITRGMIRHYFAISAQSSIENKKYFKVFYMPTAEKIVKYGIEIISKNVA